MGLTVGSAGLIQCLACRHSLLRLTEHKIFMIDFAINPVFKLILNSIIYSIDFCQRPSRTLKSKMLHYCHAELQS